MDPSTSSTASLQDTNPSTMHSANSAATTTTSPPVSKNIGESLKAGPVAETAKAQTVKTSSELQDLKNARVAPVQPAATGQPLTHYHSFFYKLLSWENPRATSIAFVVSLSFIFACRYLPALKWTFKALYLITGSTALAEIAGKLVLRQGLATSFRPRRYYTIPRETLESSAEDVTQLINFFVIEFQRVLFAENVAVTVLAFATALVSYYLLKIVPLWGLTLIGTSTLYLAPLIYVNNKRLIDDNIAHAQNLVNSQANQVKDLAGQQTARASETVKQYAGDYSNKATELIGGARNRFTSPPPSEDIPATATSKKVPTSTNTLQSQDFPQAPVVVPVKTETSAPILAQ